MSFCLKTLLLMSCVHLLLCLQSLCFSVLYESLTPLGWSEAWGRLLPSYRSTSLFFLFRFFLLSLFLLFLLHRFV